MKYIAFFGADRYFNEYVNNSLITNIKFIKINFEEDAQGRLFDGYYMHWSTINSQNTHRLLNIVKSRIRQQ